MIVYKNWKRIFFIKIVRINYNPSYGEKNNNLPMNEYLRKISHLIFGLLISLVILIFPHDQTLVILSISLLGGLYLIELVTRGHTIPLISELLERMERKDVFPGKGALFFVFCSLVTAILFPVLIAAVSVAVLAVLDSFTTIIGIRFGKHKIYNRKTLEGTIGGFVITALLLMLISPPGFALLIASAAAIVELYSPVDDNLVIPFVVAILITLIV